MSPEPMLTTLRPMALAALMARLRFSVMWNLLRGLRLMTRSSMAWSGFGFRPGFRLGFGFGFGVRVSSGCRDRYSGSSAGRSPRPPRG
eukprot:scaffold87383_cov45-Phaeocystis_antarctica.AAC.1